MFTQTMTFREKILGLGTAAILVLAGLSFGLSQVKQWRSSVSSRAMAIGLEEAEAETLLAEKELWDERAIYLDAELPDFPGRGEAASTLLSSLSDSAKTAGLEVTSPRVAELDPSPYYQSSTCQIRVEGPFEAVGRWVVAIQEGKSFREIREMKLTGDKKEKSKVTGTVLVVQYFRPEVSL